MRQLAGMTLRLIDPFQKIPNKYEDFHPEFIFRAGSKAVNFLVVEPARPPRPGSQPGQSGWWLRQVISHNIVAQSWKSHTFEFPREANSSCILRLGNYTYLAQD